MTDEDHNGIVFEVMENDTVNGKKEPRRGVYLIPNLITSLSLLSAFFSLTLSADGYFYKAALAIFVSAILDGMDGRAARLLNAQSPFGEQYDSLADMVAFGLAPAMLAYHFSLHYLGRFGLACAFVFAACAAFRLARFNVQIGIVDKRFFIGLASPLAAILIASSVMVVTDAKIDLSIAKLNVLFAVWTAICGLLMVSNVRYYSFKDFDRKKVPFVVLMAMVLLMVAVIYDIPMGILILGIIYAVSGFFITLKHKN